MKISKFPVISKTGKEYLVDITDEGYYLAAIGATVYEKVSYHTKIFKKEKERFDKLSDKTVLKCNGITTYEKYKYNYKQLAIDAVCEHENWLEKRKQDKIDKLNAEHEFNNWDGRCE